MLLVVDRNHDRQHGVERPSVALPARNSSCHMLEVSDFMERLPFQATQAGALYDGLALPVSILLDNIRSLYNVGAFFRTADAVRAEKLYLCGITGCPPQRAIAKT